ncbi:conserved hypothetical protein [Escherichia coli B171]|nr:conserved hypothetical protein [Escherichia coli B171]
MFTEFPAPAGINRLSALFSWDRNRVPRASGDKPLSHRVKPAEKQSSPRQRG